MATLLEGLQALSACEEATSWATKRKDLKRAYATNKRGDHLLWLASRLNVDRKLIVQACCDCARTALQYIPAGELRPLQAIETTEAWCRGEATVEQVRAARDAVWGYRRTAAAYAAAYAAAATAAAAAYAAYAAADAAYAATYAAYAARTKRLAECADLVRGRIPFAVMHAAWIKRFT